MSLPEIDALVFDVLGTLVDEPAGIRAGIREFAPTLSDEEVERLSREWQHHVGEQQRRVVAGERPYVPSDVLDREAAERVARATGTGEPAEIDALALSRPSPWPDVARGLERLAGHFPLVALSNASRTALLRLDAGAGLRWHQAVSAQDVRSYKPDPAVYELAIEVAGVAAERLLMIAAYAWDLRAARKAGLRTAYVARPVGDPPAPGERFDHHARDLADLAAQLGVPE
ncbi:haloacid dehalogenase, type II [Prauserella marina]|uniref:2-haloacid dehalogenase n=1 Tax=Prauserella marina TaxID=530584 RepID=A0A222VTJ4_9PSEU|nr:haloacid dehalogenase type II [Prauserella marina]ASR37152.1 haloacid dehalogenase, type II [Prauserella marina]PWV72460.1 2-haloacid dehalogenase [Prauserella marina]SDD79556.1 2-haloacid dehalogenase [Prauserella marina]